jgi:hypothetical protein
MNIRTTAVLVILIVAIGRADAQSDEPKLVLSIGGGLPLARNITVEILGAGDFHATGSGLPFTDSGLTKFEHHREIGKAASARIFALANQAAAEWQGTGEPWPDCKGAELEIQGGTKPIKTGSGCISGSWLSRPSIKRFLASLDQLLPSGWTVSEVINF